MKIPNDKQQSRAEIYMDLHPFCLNPAGKRRKKHHLKKPHLSYEERNLEAPNHSAFPGYMPWELPPVGEPNLEAYYKHFTFNFETLENVSLLLAERPMTGVSRSKKFNLESDEEVQKIMKTKEQYAIESMNRTRKIFSRLLIHNYTDSTRLITLTYAQPCYDLGDHWIHLNLMTQRFKKEYSVPLNYLAVPELHPGGHGWHWHIVVNNDWFDYKFFQDKIWGHGIVRISDKPQDSTSEKGRNMASYLVKYLGKEIARNPSNKKRYSRGGIWRTDWLVRDGVVQDSIRITRKVIAYLAQAGVPYRLNTFRPYEGQVIRSITYDSGLFPDVHLDHILHPEEHPRICNEHPQKSLTDDGGFIRRAHDIQVQQGIIQFPER